MVEDVSGLRIPSLIFADDVVLSASLNRDLQDQPLQLSEEQRQLRGVQSGAAAPPHREMDIRFGRFLDVSLGECFWHACLGRHPMTNPRHAEEIT